MTPQLATVAAWIHEAGPQGVTLQTGAGISTDSGIPDFRGPQGLWTKDPHAQVLFTLDNYVADRDVRVRAWRSRRDHPAWTAQPNAAHQALVRLEQTGRLQAIITQNIDGLHQRAGSSPEIVIEIHGTVWQAECLSCGLRLPMARALERVAAGEDDPACAACGGMMKSATISFGQSLDPVVLRASVHAAMDCELFLAVGTSLQVQPAAGLCDLARAHGARLVILNSEPTPYDRRADLVVRHPVGTALPALVDDLQT